MDRNWVFIIHERSVIAAEGNWEREVRIFRAGHPWKGRGAPPWLSLPLEPHSSMLSPSHRHLPALIIQDTPSPPLTPLTTQMYTHTLALFLYTCECDLYCTLYTQTHTFSLSLSHTHTHTYTHINFLKVWSKGQDTVLEQNRVEGTPGWAHEDLVHCVTLVDSSPIQALVYPPGPHIDWVCSQPLGRREETHSSSESTSITPALRASQKPKEILKWLMGEQRWTWLSLPS